ncbi:unnamed protein product [Miscanthus lutarioriparius]|uniref:Tryptophan synthase beta chain-like PALP domain-containing protein n=1 Tax=Miscanthus lutarioriparius TaxID=422564 RepID=A0A811SHT1_9POAL|nr:unnamed protein product [Miscanthus lutarioriparius]
MAVGAGEQEHIASDITQLIGWTPLIELKRITSKAGIDARIVGKMEAHQPLCSIKDRSVLRMIEDAEERGLISPGVTTLVEPTSDPALGFAGMFDKVERLRKQLPNVHVLNQVTNRANSEAHFRLTGTGGTVSGVGKYLKMQKPGVKIICVEPAESPVISGGAPGKHKIQGVGPGFIPEVLDTSVIDETVTVTTEEAMANARRLAKEEGLLVGISSGANLAACLKVASREENKGKVIVTVFPSGGERYMNSDLFADVREECIAMTF